MVTTQDVSFGTLWTKLVGERARWAPGDDDAPALQASETSPAFGMGLVAVWVAGDGPVLVCEPTKGLRALKSLPKGTPIDALQRALRESGAVVREDDAPRRDSMV
jgi:hypothetical protein